MPLEIVTYPAKVLQRPARKITADDGIDLHQLYADMKVAMFEYGGIGLAAPQVGLGIRMFLAHETKSGITHAFVNPQIIESSTEITVGSEGCLSFPQLFGDVERSLEVVVKYQDLDLNHHEERFSEFFARIIQHENDHLNGVLLPDRSIGDLYTYENEEEEPEGEESPASQNGSIETSRDQAR